LNDTAQKQKKHMPWHVNIHKVGALKKMTHPRLIA